MWEEVDVAGGGRIVPLETPVGSVAVVAATLVHDGCFAGALLGLQLCRGTIPHPDKSAFAFKM